MLTILTKNSQNLNPIFKELYFFSIMVKKKKKKKKKKNDMMKRFFAKLKFHLKLFVFYFTKMLFGEKGMKIHLFHESVKQ